jgi:hypothetical protein
MIGDQLPRWPAAAVVARGGGGSLAAGRVSGGAAAPDGEPAAAAAGRPGAKRIVPRVIASEGASPLRAGALSSEGPGEGAEGFAWDAAGPGYASWSAELVRRFALEHAALRSGESEMAALEEQFYAMCTGSNFH